MTSKEPEVSLGRTGHAVPVTAHANQRGRGASVGASPLTPDTPHQARTLPAPRRSGEPAPLRKPIGARELSQLALNRDCLRMLAVVLSGCDQTQLVAALYDEPSQPDGSLPKQRAGVAFEHALTRDGFAGLIELLTKAGVITVNGPTPIDVRARFPENDAETLARREALTRELLQRMLQCGPSAPTVIGHPRLPLRVGSQTIHIEPDAIVLPRDANSPTPLEVKGYTDRGGRTDIVAYSRARLQAAVELLATETAVRSLGGPVPLAPRVELVFRQRASRKATLRTVDIASEVDQMRSVLADAPSRLDAALEALPLGESLETRRGLEAIPAHFTEHCHLHCKLAARCEAAARACGGLSVLGAEFEHAAAAAGSTPRLVALIERRTPPRTAAEAETASAFRDAEAALEREGLLPPRPQSGDDAKPGDSDTEVRRAG